MSWMSVAATGQAPMPSRSCRLPKDSAIERGSLAACSTGFASITAMRAAGTPRRRSSRASESPTGPAPQMAMSKSADTSVAHQCFNVGHVFRHAIREDFAAVGGDERIVFDADADMPELLRHAFRRTHI